MTPKQIAIDVTNLTPTQRRQIFQDYFNQTGLIKFIKTTNDQSIIYKFDYT